MFESASVEKWLNRLAPSTARVQANYFNKFMKWVKEYGGEFKDFTPDQLIEYQKKADNGSKYDMIDLAQRYMSQCKDRQGTKDARYSNIKSFFLHNRAELPKDPSFQIRSRKEKVRGTLKVDD
jgi:hypothetical protein